MGLDVSYLGQICNDGLDKRKIDTIINNRELHGSWHRKNQLIVPL